MRRLAFLLAGAGWLAACAALPPEPAPKSAPTATELRQLEILAAFLTGTYESIPGLPGNADPTPVTLHHVRLWPERKGEFWLYAEYARAGAQATPYRQRIYRFWAEGGEIRAATYRLPGEPSRFALEWRKDPAFAGVDPATLVERENCRLRFAAQHLSLFSGGTLGQKCPSDAKEAAYETSEFYVTSTSIRNWDRGFDAAGRQVLGSRVGPLELRKTSEAQR